MKKLLLKRGILLLAIVDLGLLSRRLPIIPAETGDALWAMVVFLAWAILLPGKSSRTLAVLALTSSYLVEFSQLLTWDWLVQFRATTIGHLLLGQGFLVSDLIAYLIGVVLIAILDYQLFLKNNTSS